MTWAPSSGPNALSRESLFIIESVKLFCRAEGSCSELFRLELSKNLRTLEISFSTALIDIVNDCCTAQAAELS